MLDALIERIRAAHDTRSPLIIQGGGSKTFYGGADEGEVLGTRKLTGIVDYQPKELVLTARAGTPLADIEAQLAEQNQMLAFEPPHFGGCPHPNPDGTTKQSTDGTPSHSTRLSKSDNQVAGYKPASGQVAAYLPLAGEGANAEPKPVYATLGGCIAAGLSGPRRPYAGAARDFVLGVRMIDGTGQPLRFGGQVIKNVAGYDVSRLMVGALGTLGLITEVSLKVLPKPAAERTLQFELDEAAAIERMNQWAGQPLPLSATSWHAGLLTVRLSGAASAVQAAQAKLGGEQVSDAAAFWLRLRDQTTPFFDIRSSASNQSLWRLAVKPTAPPLTASHRLGGDAQWIEWGGAVRWLVSDRPAATLREAAQSAGGHATLFRGTAPSPQPSPRTGEGANMMPRAIYDGAFTPLAPALLAVHRKLKQRFDPQGIFNHGRLYPDF